MKIQIELGGKPRQLWFNNYSKGAIGGIYGIDAIEATEKLIADISANYMRAISNLVLAGLEGFHEATDTTRDYAPKDVKMWCAEASDDEMAKVFNTWLSASSARDLIPSAAEGEAPKKPRGRKSKTSR